MTTTTTNKKEEANQLYACFREEVLRLGANFRHLFVFKSRGIMTMKLLCTGLICNDGRELLRGLDALSLAHASIDRAVDGDRERGKDDDNGFEMRKLMNTVYYTEYHAFRQSFIELVDRYRGRDVWYETPLGLCTALYLAHRLKYCTVQCFKFETLAACLVETTSFRAIKPWHRWVSGLRVCVQCQYTGSDGDQSGAKELRLCDTCENAYYCSLKCKKKNALAHKNYCRRPQSLQQSWILLRENIPILVDNIINTGQS